MTEALLGVGLLTAFVLLLSSAVMAARSRLMPGGAITVTVNGAKSLSARAGSTLLGVLQEAGIPVVLGGHSLVAAGLWLLSEMIVKEREAEGYRHNTYVLSRGYRPN